MSITESYEFENQLTNRLGKRAISPPNEEELEVKKMQDEILRETAMVEMQKKEVEEEKVEGDFKHLDDIKNIDQLSFNSVELVKVEEESSDEGAPEAQ